MKFAKQLETEAEDIPTEWRPYLIQYKALKKLISKIAAEIERRGLSASLLRECLKQGTDYEKGFRIKYYFTGNICPLCTLSLLKSPNAIVLKANLPMSVHASSSTTLAMNPFCLIYSKSSRSTT